jgi:hypothetical protein
VRALILLGVFAMAGCQAECIDRFDCLRLRPNGDYTCNQGTCLAVMAVPDIAALLDAGPRPDAGRPDAGQRDAGPGDAGRFSGGFARGQVIGGSSASGGGSAVGALVRLVDAGYTLAVSGRWSLDGGGPAVAVTLGFGAYGGEPFSPSVSMPFDGGDFSWGPQALSAAQAAEVLAERLAVQVEGPDAGLLRAQMLSDARRLGVARLSQDAGVVQLGLLIPPGLPTQIPVRYGGRWAPNVAVEGDFRVLFVDGGTSILTTIPLTPNGQGCRGDEVIQGFPMGLPRVELRLLDGGVLAGDVSLFF